MAGPACALVLLLLAWPHCVCQAFSTTPRPLAWSQARPEARARFALGRRGAAGAWGLPSAPATLPPRRGGRQLATMCSGGQGTLNAGSSATQACLPRRRVPALTIMHLSGRRKTSVHDPGSEAGAINLDDLGLPKTVKSEIQGLSIEEQNMILGAVGLAPTRTRKQKQARRTGAGTGETAAQRRSRRKAAQERRDAPTDAGSPETSTRGKTSNLQAEAATGKGHPAPPPKPKRPSKDPLESAASSQTVKRARDEEALFARDEDEFFRDELPSAKKDQA